MTRIVSGIVLATLTLALLFLGSPLHFFIIANLVAIVCALEFFRLVEKWNEDSFKILGIASTIALLFAFYTEDIQAIVVVTFATLLTTMITSVLTGGKKPIKGTANTLLGVFYIAIPMAAISLIRNEPDGNFLVLMLILSNAFGDIFAYYTGRSIGKRPLAKSISPNKTIEGFLGGVVGAMVGALAIKGLFIPELGYVHAMAGGAIAGLIGPIGDLAESAIKREANAKDSGSIIPGHGGALDRLDSLMFTATAFYIYFQLTGLS